jgi:hypothetical protein
MSIRWLRRQGDQPQLLKNDCPNLPREDTGHQNMLDSLPDLITKRACSRMRQATLCKTVGCPASVVENKPNEEFAFQGSPTLPDSLPRSKPDSTNEEGLIG